MKKYYVVNENYDVVFRGVYDSRKTAVQQIADIAKHIIAINDGIMIRAAEERIPNVCSVIVKGNTKNYHWSIGTHDYWLWYDCDSVAFGANWKLDHEGQAYPKIDHEYKIMPKELYDEIDNMELPF